jgi:hypothetical protein
MMTGDVWRLVIERTGLGDKEYHRSIHVNPLSTRNKADAVLRYDVPDLSEWYERPADDSMATSRTGYVLDRDEIGSWPIRIEATREEVLERE